MKTRDAWENSECYQKLLYILSVLLYGSVMISFIRNSAFKCEIRSFLHTRNSTRPLLHQLFWTDITNVKPNPGVPEWVEQEKNPTFSFHLSYWYLYRALQHIAWCSIIPVSLITWLTWTILFPRRRAHTSTAKQHKYSLFMPTSPLIFGSQNTFKVLMKN